MSIQVQQLCSKLVTPTYNGDHPPLITQFVPLSVFDRLAEAACIPLIYAYKPPTPSNTMLEQGLRKALTEYREWAGRFCTDDNGHHVIQLNDKGLRFIEASTDCTLDQAMPFTPSTLLSLNPSFNGVKELALVQLTRFTCGSLVVSFSANHMVADGVLVSQFLVAWGQACRGLEIDPSPLHDRSIFAPRDPSRVEFDHKSVELTKGKIKEEYISPDNKPPYSRDDVILHKAHFTPEFIAKLKSKAATSSVSGVNRPYSAFESMVAHLWRAITRVRGLTKFQTTEIRISVNGRRRLKPRVPNEYFGNLVLWAYPAAQVKDLLHESLSHTAEIIHEAVMKVNDDYFKSFIDFASYNLQDEDLIPEANRSLSALWPNLEFISWLGFPFNNIDFGVGKPCILMPSFDPLEGLIYLVPSFAGDGGIDVFITLFQQQLALFEEICYSID
ncbi:Transferase [Macleaya cordata]|uniref:Transferase n=1 Tax=Macleaya cordata TaxID=56857 RepID=A0A200PXR2_MACCD|nr:Transferase [Macleaya cordata]